MGVQGTALLDFLLSCSYPATVRAGNKVPVASSALTPFLMRSFLTEISSVAGLQYQAFHMSTYCELMTRVRCCWRCTGLLLGTRVAAGALLRLFCSLRLHVGDLCTDLLLSLTEHSKPILLSESFVPSSGLQHEKLGHHSAW